MTRDVLVRKVAHLQTLLADLRPHAGKTFGEIMEDHYEVERLLELLVQIGVGIVSHELAERGIVPETCRDAFKRAGRNGILPPKLALSLADAAGLRNVLVHLYDEIDFEILAASVDEALADFTRLARLYAERLVEDDNT